MSMDVPFGFAVAPTRSAQISTSLWPRRLASLQFTYQNTVNDECADVNAKCMALTETEVFASAVSQQAAAAVTLTQDLCKMSYNSGDVIYEDAGKIARAMVEVRMPGCLVCRPGALTQHRQHDVSARPRPA